MKTKTARLLHVSALMFSGFKEAGFNNQNWIELSKGFDQLHLLARNSRNRFKSEKNSNIFLHLMPKIGRSSVFGLLTLPYLFILIPQKRITHLLCQSSIFGGIYAIWASKLYKIPVLVEIHGEEYFRYLESTRKRHLLLKWIIRYVYRNATKIRSLNLTMTNKLARFGFTKNVVEIPNRVNLETFSPPKKDFSIGAQISIISVGRFVKEKNYSQLIRTLASSGLDFKLCLIGGGPLREEYEQIIAHFDIKTRITLIDWINQEEMIQRITAADLYVQFSISEGMPRTILEAMALRMPIISTNVGSIAGVIKDHVNGIILTENFEAELLRAVQALISDIQLRTTIAERAYKDVVDKYEWNRMYELYRAELLTMT